MKCDCHGIEMYPCPKCKILTCVAPIKLEYQTPALCPNCNTEIKYPENKPTNLPEIGI